MAPRTSREHARKKFDIFFTVSSAGFCLSCLALVALRSPPVPLAVNSRPVLFFTVCNLLNLCLLGYTVYLQAKVFSFDHETVTWKLLCYGFGQRRQLVLPILLAGIVLDLVIFFVL